MDLLAGSFAALLIATIAFCGSHVVMSNRPVRPMLVGAIGELPFMLVYSIVAGITLAWMIWAYGATPLNPPLIYLGTGGRIAANILMLLSVIFFVGAYSTANPTAIGREKLLEEGKAKATGILRITRHPGLWAFTFWAVAHLAANTMARDLVLFIGIAALALVGMVSIDAKRAARMPEAYRRYTADTSNVPFAAVVAGKQSALIAAREYGIFRLIGALVLYAALVYLHPILFGVSPHP